MAAQAPAVVWVRRRSFRRLGWWGALWLVVLIAGWMAEVAAIGGPGSLQSSLAAYWPGYLAVAGLVGLAFFGISYLVEPGWIGLTESGVRFRRRGGPITAWADLADVRRAGLGGVILRIRASGGGGPPRLVRRLDLVQFGALADHPRCPERIRSIR